MMKTEDLRNLYTLCLYRHEWWRHDLHEAWDDGDTDKSPFSTTTTTTTTTATTKRPTAAQGGRQPAPHHKHCRQKWICWSWQQKCKYLRAFCRNISANISSSPSPPVSHKPRRDYWARAPGGHYGEWVFRFEIRVTSAVTPVQTLSRNNKPPNGLSTSIFYHSFVHSFIDPDLIRDYLITPVIIGLAPTVQYNFPVSREPITDW